MDTINNLATSASKAIWGEETAKPTEGEPISGAQGNTAAGEPFDAGNKEPASTTTSGLTDNKSSTSGLTDNKSSTSPTSGTTGVTGSTTDNLTDRTKESTKPVTGHDDPEGTHGPHDSKVANAADPRVDSDKDGRGAPTSGSTSGVTGTTGSTTGASKDLKPNTTVNSGNDTRDPDDAMDLKTSDARHNVDDSGGVDSSDNPVKVDGPGPKPVNELAQEHGGNAGAASGGDSTLPGEDKKESKTAEDGEDPNAESKGEGTGEQYVKSSGLKADGGDFDATKPGAGREADRLLEEKGIHKPSADAKDKGSEITPTASTSDKTSDASGSPATKDKASLKDKIKAKLHKDKS